MATYYTFDCAVEDFLHWHGKCLHYGIDPKAVIAKAYEEYSLEEEEPKAYLPGDSCPECGFELMEISKENLQKSKKNKPEFKSFTKEILTMDLPFTPICPQCDAYALGMEMEEGIQVRDKDGNTLTVHDLEETLWKS